MKKTFFLFLVAFSLACQKPSSPAEMVAFQFVDAYYAHVNLQTALGFADGYAADKIQTSVSLTEGQTKDGTHQPKITYKLEKSDVGSTEGQFIFLVTIEPEKAEPLRKNVLIKVRHRTDAGWKVTQFSDNDLAE